MKKKFIQKNISLKPGSGSKPTSRKLKKPKGSESLLHTNSSSVKINSKIVKNNHGIEIIVDDNSEVNETLHHTEENRNINDSGYQGVNDTESKRFRKAPVVKIHSPEEVQVETKARCNKYVSLDVQLYLIYTYT